MKFYRYGLFKLDFCPAGANVIVLEIISCRIEQHIESEIKTKLEVRVNPG